MNMELTPEQIAQKEQDEKDIAEFNKGLQALIERTRVTLLAKIMYTEDGIRPVLKHGRLRPVEEPAQEAREAKKPVRPKKNAKK